MRSSAAGPGSVFILPGGSGVCFVARARVCVESLPAVCGRPAVESERGREMSVFEQTALLIPVLVWQCLWELGVRVCVLPSACHAAFQQSCVWHCN